MFKQRAIFCALLAATVIIAAVYPADIFGEETPAADKVTIEALAKKPAKFVGKELRVEGVVASVMTDDRMFLMAEKKSACGGCPSKLSCGVTELTVFYEGKLPGKNKKLMVTGVLTEPEKGRYVFKASRLE